MLSDFGSKIPLAISGTGNQIVKRHANRRCSSTVSVLKESTSLKRILLTAELFKLQAATRINAAAMVPPVVQILLEAIQMAPTVRKAAMEMRESDGNEGISLAPDDENELIKIKKRRQISIQKAADSEEKSES